MLFRSHVSLRLSRHEAVPLLSSLLGLRVVVADGRDGLHGLEHRSEQVVELHIVELGTHADDVTVAARSEALVLEGGISIYKAGRKG